MVRNYNNLSKEITLTGFFSEYLPSCFKLPDSILLRIPPSNCDVIAPLSFNMSRFSENNARRTLFIPEIGSYLATYQYMRDNNIFQELIEFTESTNHSFSPILDDDDNIFRHEQSYGAENTNSDINEKSEYIKNISKKIKLAAGAKKILKLDISNCFSSFYMHMIPAILLGAEGAEENYNKHNKNPEDETIAQVRKKRTMKKNPSYGRIKETTIGGIFMPRNYRHIKQYEEEMMKLKEGGMTVREIGEKFGLTYEQTHDFF